MPFVYFIGFFQREDPPVPSRSIVVPFVYFVKFFQRIRRLGSRGLLDCFRYYLINKQLKEMAPATNEEQFKFLISCIRYSNNGKVSCHSNMFILTSAILTAIRSTSAKLPKSATLCLKAQRKSHLRHLLLASHTPSPSAFISNLGSHHSSHSLQPEQNQADHFRSAKRYERLMKFHGIHQSQTGSTSVSAVREASVASTRRKSPAAPSTTSNKKRKLISHAETTSNLNTDDDEGFENVKPESNTGIKAEAIKAEAIKGEASGQESIPDSTSYTDLTASTGAFQSAANSAYGFDGIQDSAMFDDFLRFGGTSQANNGIQTALSGNESDGGTASTNMAPATGSGDGHKVQESILIVD